MSNAYYNIRTHTLTYTHTYTQKNRHIFLTLIRIYFCCCWLLLRLLLLLMPSLLLFVIHVLHRFDREKMTNCVFPFFFFFFSCVSCFSYHMKGSRSFFFSCIGTYYLLGTFKICRTGRAYKHRKSACRTTT